MCESEACPFGKWFHFECLKINRMPGKKKHWFCSNQCFYQHETLKRKTLNMKQVTIYKGQWGNDPIDSVYHYSRALLWRSLTQLAFKDAIRHNNGPRILGHWKFDLISFWCKNHPLYFRLAHQLLTDVNGGVCDSLAHMLTWERTVNKIGGPGNNISKDLFCEHCIKEAKGKLQ